MRLIKCKYIRFEGAEGISSNYLHHTWTDFLYWDTVLDKN